MGLKRGFIVFVDFALKINGGSGTVMTMVILIKINFFVEEDGHL